MNRVALGEGKAVLIKCLGWRKRVKISRKWKRFACMYEAFMDLEQTHDKIDRKVYGIDGKLLRAVDSFNRESKACMCEGGYRRRGVLPSEGWSKTGVCHVSVVVQQLHRWLTSSTQSNIVFNVFILLSKIFQHFYSNHSQMILSDQKTVAKLHWDGSELLIFLYCTKQPWHEEWLCILRANVGYNEVVNEFWKHAILEENGESSYDSTTSDIAYRREIREINITDFAQVAPLQRQSLQHSMWSDLIWY